MLPSRHIALPRFLFLLRTFAAQHDGSKATKKTILITENSKSQNTPFNPSDVQCCSGKSLTLNIFGISLADARMGKRFKSCS
jgi:hypothetical protein